MTAESEKVLDNTAAAHPKVDQIMIYPFVTDFDVRR